MLIKEVGPAIDEKLYVFAQWFGQWFGNLDVADVVMFGILLFCLILVFVAVVYNEG